MKVGVTKSVMRRFTQINKDCPLEIKIVRTYGPMERRYAYQLETYLHLYFNDIKEKGEWFKYSDDFSKQLDMLLQDVSVTDLSTLVDNEKIKKRGLQQNIFRKLGGADGE